MANRVHYLKLHFIVFLYGFTAILGLLITIPAIELVVLRTCVAAIGMGALLFFLRKSFVVSQRNFLLLVVTGLVVGIHWIAFFSSARVSNASVSLVGVATGSLWASIIGPIMNKTKIRGYEVVLGLLVILGLYIIFSFNFEYPLGLALGVFAGFLSALFFTLNQRLGQRVDAYQITFYEMIFACVGALIYLWIHTTWVDKNYTIQFNLTWSDVVCIVLLGWVCTVYAFSASVNLMKHLSSFFIQLSMNLEPVYGIILAVLIFGKAEKMTMEFYAGTTIILLSVACYPLLKKKFHSDPLEGQRSLPE